MRSIADTDYGTPAIQSLDSLKLVRLEIDGAVVKVPAGTSVMRAAALNQIGIPRLCATDTLDAFGSCRLCLVQIDGMKGYPASCTTPVAEGMKVTTQSAKLAEIRRGVMELYISDHPLDCLTCPADGHCELQDMAGAVGLREVRYGYDGENHVQAKAAEAMPIRSSPTRRIQSVFQLRSLQVHRLLALRARLRRGAGHVRADHPGSRLRLEGRRPARTNRSSLPNACPAAPACRPARPRPCRRNR